MDKQQELTFRAFFEYDFEAEDGEFGTTYGVKLLKETFPDAYRIKGMSMFYVPNVGTFVVTCRRLALVRRASNNGRTPKPASFQEPLNC